MDDDLGLRTFLAAGLDSILEQRGEAQPVGIFVGVAPLERRRAALAPAHTVAYLVARLYEVGFGTGSLQGLQALLGVVVDFVVELQVGERHPGIGSVLLHGVGPGVRVVEVEQELQSGILDALAQGGNVGQVLAHTFLFLGIGSLGGVHEQAHAHGIEPVVAREGYHVRDSGSGSGAILRAVGLVGRQQRDVATNIFLSLHATGKQQRYEEK